MDTTVDIIEEYMNRMLLEMQRQEDEAYESGDPEKILDVINRFY